MLVSVLLPSTGRPERAEACVRQLRESADVEIVAAVDADPETAERLGPLVDKLLICPVYRGNSRAWNDCLLEAEGDPIVFAADDLEWEPGWLEAALAKLAEFPDGWGLVGFNDGHIDGDVGFSAHYLMSRRFIIEVLGGVVAWEHYRHSFNDAEVNDRARAAGRYAWAADAHVTHRHWIFGDRAQDRTDVRTLGEHSDSERIYNERKAKGFPIDYAPVITA